MKVEPGGGKGAESGEKKPTKSEVFWPLKMIPEKRNLRFSPIENESIWTQPSFGFLTSSLVFWGGASIFSEVGVSRFRWRFFGVWTSPADQSHHKNPWQDMITGSFTIFVRRLQHVVALCTRVPCNLRTNSWSVRHLTAEESEIYGNENWILTFLQQDEPS